MKPPSLERFLHWGDSHISMHLGQIVIRSSQAMLKLWRGVSARMIFGFAVIVLPRLAMSHWAMHGRQSRACAEGQWPMSPALCVAEAQHMREKPEGAVSRTSECVDQICHFPVCASQIKMGHCSSFKNVRVASVKVLTWLVLFLECMDARICSEVDVLKGVSCLLGLSTGWGDAGSNA